MGIRMGEGGTGNAFSEDILKIEISGPEVCWKYFWFLFTIPNPHVGSPPHRH